MSSAGAMSHDEAIGQFCGVTGADEDRAKGLLEACDWNLELAINMHVDTDDGRNRPSTSNSAAGPSTSRPEVITELDESIIEDDDEVEVTLARHGARQNARKVRATPDFPVSSDNVRPPIPPVRRVLVQNPIGYSPDLPQRRYNTRSSPGATDAFRDFQAEAAWQEMVALEGGSSTSADQASGASNSNKSSLLELFRPPLDLTFHGSLSSAREVATTKNKWLLVNLQNAGEFACQMLNRDVWSNQTVKDILKEHFIFWQMYHDNFEGSRYVQFYNPTSYPHVSIIDPRTGEQMKTWPTTIDHNSFCDSVIEFLTEHPSPDGSSEEVVTITSNDTNTDTSTDTSIANSSTEQEAEIVSEDYKKYLGADTEKFSDLVVRFPDGTRDQIKFPSDSLMKALFLFLASRGYGKNKYNYVTNFPRRLLHELPEADTLFDAKLNRETIHVEPRVK